jgi:hypothetical protein
MEIFNLVFGGNESSEPWFKKGIFRTFTSGERGDIAYFPDDIWN